LDKEWNQDKTDAYGYAMSGIYEHINKILEEKSEIPYVKQNHKGPEFFNNSK